MSLAINSEMVLFFQFHDQQYNKAKEQALEKDKAIQLVMVHLKKQHLLKLVIDPAFLCKYVRGVDFPRKLRAITEIALPRIQLAAWPGFKSFSGLRRLDLSHNQLREIPQDDKLPQMLEELDLSHNQLVTYSLSNPLLKKLNLSHNLLKVFVRRIENRGSLLVSLDLSHNYLLDIPFNIDEIATLTAVNLTANCLSQESASYLRTRFPNLGPSGALVIGKQRTPMTAPLRPVSTTEFLKHSCASFLRMVLIGCLICYILSKMTSSSPTVVR